MSCDIVILGITRTHVVSAGAAEIVKCAMPKRSAPTREEFVTVMEALSGG